MKRITWMLLALLAIAAFPAATLAADDTSDRPNWAGSDPDGDKPGNKNDEPGVVMGEDYGDLWVIKRDGDGVPILDLNGCLQPVAADGTILAMDYIAEEDACELPLDLADLVQEVEFGRISVVRSPDFVLESSLAEAMNTLNAATAITLDAAGRLFVTRELEIDGVLTEVSKAIDSPLENIALYQQIMLNGFLPGLGHDATFLGDLAYLQCAGGSGTENPPGEALDANDFNQAAAFFAAAADKTGTLSLDMIVTVNTWLDLNPFDTNGNRTYYDYGYDDGYYNHDAQIRYAGIAPLLLTGPVDQGDGLDWFFIGPRVVLDEVTFNVQPSWYLPGGATEFAEAADNALQVIEFIHNWAIPAY